MLTFVIYWLRVHPVKVGGKRGRRMAIGHGPPYGSWHRHGKAGGGAQDRDRRTLVGEQILVKLHGRNKTPHTHECQGGTTCRTYVSHTYGVEHARVTRSPRPLCTGSFGPLTPDTPPPPRSITCSLFDLHPHLLASSGIGYTTGVSWLDVLLSSMVM